ncbi:MAG: hypothetical protein ACLGH6_05215 [Gammaproteobacteria bacterium]
MNLRHPHQDEHMTHYEWSGALTAIPLNLPAGTRRDHPWHASTAILALLASLLILNGCDRQGPAEEAGAQIDEAVQDMKDAVDPPGPAQEAGRAIDDAREDLGEKVEQIGEDMQKP